MKNINNNFYFYVIKHRNGLEIMFVISNIYTTSFFVNYSHTGVYDLFLAILKKCTCNNLCIRCLQAKLRITIFL